MSGAPRNSYTSMVLQSNAQGPQPPFTCGTPPKKIRQPYRSSQQNSASMYSESVPVPCGSMPLMASTAPSMVSPLVAQQFASLPSSMYFTGRPSGYESCEMARSGPRYSQHNPYAAICTTPLTRPSHPPDLDAFNSVFHASSSVLSPSTASTPSTRGLGTPQSTLDAPCAGYATSDSVSGGETCVVAATLEEQFCGILGNIPASAMSSRGRHLLLNVLRRCDPDKTQIIYDELAPQFSKVAMDQHGCHVMRTLIELISTAQMEALVPFMEPAVVLQMATATQHTRRVLQAVFEHHASTGLMPLVEVIRSDCMRLSMNQQGCIVIIRVVEHAIAEQKRALISSLVPILPSLAEDQFGNYVVQCILKNMEGYVSFNDLVGSFRGHWVKLSCDKYSSNVMERIIGMLRDGPRQLIVNELILNEVNLQQLMQNSFGNYVLQAIISSAVDLSEFKRIYDSVTPFLHTSPYGHRIDARLKSRFEALNKNGTASCSPTEVSQK